MVSSVKGDHLERFLLRNATIFDGLRGLYIHPTYTLVGVGVNRHGYTPFIHDGHVVGNGVPCLHLVAPKVSKCRGAGTMSRDFIGDFIAFEHMLERGNLKTEVLRDSQ